jgi:hypothetical protein
MHRTWMHCKLQYCLLYSTTFIGADSLNFINGSSKVERQFAYINTLCVQYIQCHWHTRVREANTCIKNTIFLDVMLCNVVEVYGYFGGNYWLQLQGWRVIPPCKQSAQSVNVPSKCQPTWRDTPEDSTLYSHDCENLKSWRLINNLS